MSEMKDYELWGTANLSVKATILESVESIVEEFMESWNGFFLTLSSATSQKLRLLARAGNPSSEAHVDLWCRSIFHV
jgi:hypothetical protein